MINWLLSLIWVPFTLVVIAVLVLVVEPIAELLEHLKRKETAKGSNNESN